MLLVLAVLGVARGAQAQWPHAVGRYLGVGWSDGYHARAPRPPRHAAAPAASPAALPWWMIPAESAEPQPHPAAPPGPSAAPLPPPPAGASLFRRPGEGTTVRVTTAAGVTR